MNNYTFTLTHDGNEYEGSVNPYPGGRLWLSSVAIDKQLFASDGPTRYHAIANLKTKIYRTFNPEPLPSPNRCKPIHPYRKDPDPFLDELEHLTWLADHGLQR